MAKKTTRADVAREAGVSPACVSIVMSGRGDSVGIAKATQERVSTTARRLGYYPSTMMRSILRGRSNVIGAFVGWGQWSEPRAYWMEVTRGLQAATALAGQDLLLHSDAPGSSTEAIFERLAGGMVDGVLLEHEGSAGLASLVADSPLPAIAVGWVHPTIPSVTIDSDSGVALIVRHLIEKGYRDLAYLDPAETPSAAMAVRRRGFERAVTEAGRPQDASRVVGMRSAETVVDDLMALSPRPRAVVCYNDPLAYTLLGACMARGIDVPGELALVGFDGIPVPPSVRQITTVRTPILEMCRLSVASLLDRIEGREVPALTELSVTDLEPGTTA